MSDYQQDPGATQVMPAVPPSAPPAAPGSPPAGPAGGRGGVPWWALVLVALIVAGIVGGATWVFARGGAAGIEDRIDALVEENAALKAEVAALRSRPDTDTTAPDALNTVDGGSTPASVTPDATEEAPAAPSPPSTATERQFTLIKKVTWDAAKGYQLTADYEQLTTGDAAFAAAAAHGDTIEGESFYIANDNPKLRTFTLANDADIRVLNWSGATGTQATKIPVGQFMDIMRGGTNPQDPWKDAHYWITVRGGTTVIKVEHQYFP